MADDTVTVNLKVLSPSREIEGGLHLLDLPASTTVSELRRKIQDAVPSKPGPERMRLIYRGKVVANDADTLETVFGADNLRESKDQSLHLVLRELPNAPSTSTAAPSTASAASTPAPPPATATATAPPNPPNAAQPPAARPLLHTNPFRAIPHPRPDSQPPPGAHHHHHAHHPHVHHHHHHHAHAPLHPLGPVGAVPLPPHLQHQIAQALGQRAALGTPPVPGAASAPATPAQPAGGASPRPASADGAPAPGVPQPGALPRGALPPGMLPPGVVPPSGFGGAPAPHGTTVRQEGIGPNGARWSVTYNDFTAHIPLRPGQPTMPRPAPVPPTFGAPPAAATPAATFGSPASDAVNAQLASLRNTLHEANQEAANIRTLLDPSAVEHALSSGSGAPPFPAWRADRIREHLRTITHSLNTVEAGLADPALHLNPDAITLRQTVGAMRTIVNAHTAVLAAREGSGTWGVPQSTSPAAGVAGSSSSTHAPPANVPQQLFLLSSPDGPVGLLFDQQGTYTTAPFTSAVSSQAFVDQFTQNRQLIASLSQQIAQTSQNIQGQLDGTLAGGVQPAIVQPAIIQPTPTQPPAQPQPAQQPEVFDQAAAQRVIQNIIQNRNERQADNAPAAANNDRAGNIAGHLWLVFKLACFVYIFAGGGGWYRPLMLSSIAIIVYVVQLGVFDAQFNVIRRYFEALLPTGERQGQQQNNAPANANANATTAPDAHRNITPEEAARRILQQQRNNQFGWARDTFRTLERGVALFVASLWPGIGERMVHAQEERERLERVAASEEAERVEAERRRAEEEAEKDREREKEAEKEKEREKEAEKEKEREKKGEGSAESAQEKPALHRNATQTLSEDFMDSAVSSSEKVEEKGEGGIPPTAKGKERAADSETV